jgi:hypothetical protein
MAQSSNITAAAGAQTVLTAVSVPWNAFIAAFLYYVLLALVVVGDADFSPLVMAVAYLVPVVCYVAMLLNRGVHALVALPIEIGETPHALQH